MNLPLTEAKTLSLAAATAIVDAVVSEAESRGFAMSVVVLDNGANIKAISRMDGAGLLSVAVAHDKAYTAAATGVGTHHLLDFIETDRGSATSMPTQPRFTVVAGGLPVVIDGQAVGAFGVSGGAAPDDLEVANAALVALGLSE